MNKFTTANQESPQMEIAHVEVVETDLFRDFIKLDADKDLLTISPETPYEVWFGYTQGILEFTRRSMKIAGQLLIFGEQVYGERAWQVVDAMRYNPKTLQNAMWVCKGIAEWHDRLSFGHHEVVAALPPIPQSELLTVAENEGLTISKLKKLKNEKYPDKGKSKSKKSPPKIDLQDEAEVLQAGHMMIAFLEKAEADKPFREWPAKRLDLWKPILTTLTKIARRSIIKTH